MIQRFLFGAIFTVALTMPALAGNITSISVGGPGGTGSAEIDPSPGAQFVAFASFDFTSDNSITLVAAVDGPGYYDVILIPGFYGQGISNDTDTIWTNLLIQTDQLVPAVGEGDEPRGFLPNCTNLRITSPCFMMVATYRMVAKSICNLPSRWRKRALFHSL